jgi:hypothetical protein
LDDLKVGPQKLRLLFSLTGSAIGVTYTDVAVIVVVVMAAVAVVGDMMVGDVMMCALIVKDMRKWWGEDRVA